MLRTYERKVVGRGGGGGGGSGHQALPYSSGWGEESTVVENLWGHTWKCEIAYTIRPNVPIYSRNHIWEYPYLPVILPGIGLGYEATACGEIKTKLFHSRYLSFLELFNIVEMKSVQKTQRTKTQWGIGCGCTKATCTNMYQTKRKALHPPFSTLWSVLYNTVTVGIPVFFASCFTVFNLTDLYLANCSPNFAWCLRSPCMSKCSITNRAPCPLGWSKTLEYWNSSVKLNPQSIPGLQGIGLNGKINCILL